MAIRQLPLTRRRIPRAISISKIDCHWTAPRGSLDRGEIASGGQGDKARIQRETVPIEVRRRRDFGGGIPDLTATNWVYADFGVGVSRGSVALGDKALDRDRICFGNSCVYICHL